MAVSFLAPFTTTAFGGTLKSKGAHTHMVVSFVMPGYHKDSHGTETGTSCEHVSVCSSKATPHKAILCTYHIHTSKLFGN